MNQDASKEIENESLKRIFEKYGRDVTVIKASILHKFPWFNLDKSLQEIFNELRKIRLSYDDGISRKDEIENIAVVNDNNELLYIATPLDYITPSNYITMPK